MTSQERIKAVVHALLTQNHFTQAVGLKKWFDEYLDAYTQLSDAQKMVLLEKYSSTDEAFRFVALVSRAGNWDIVCDPEDTQKHQNGRTVIGTFYWQVLADEAIIVYRANATDAHD